MMTKQQAIAYGKRTGVKYYIYGDGALYGGTRTKEQAERMKAECEAEDKKNPYTKGTTKFEIREAEA